MSEDPVTDLLKLLDEAGMQMVFWTCPKGCNGRVKWQHPECREAVCEVCGGRRSEDFRVLGEIPVISLWQPWAEWVIQGWKTIETRLHMRFIGLTGKRIGIHAAQRWDPDAMEAAKPWLSPEQIEETRGWWGLPKLTGVMLGAVNVTGFRRLVPADGAAALISCEDDPIRFGLELARPLRLPFMPTVRGKQGIWKYNFSQEGVSSC